MVVSRFVKSLAISTTVLGNHQNVFFKASRSCHEMKLLGVSTSGTYFIDPDGFQGSPPVQVYCDMKTGKYPKSMANINFHLYLFQVLQL